MEKTYNTLLAELENIVAQIKNKAGNDIRKDFYTDSAKEAISILLNKACDLEQASKQIRHEISRNGLLYY